MDVAVESVGLSGKDSLAPAAWWSDEDSVAPAS